VLPMTTQLTSQQLQDRTQQLENRIASLEAELTQIEQSFKSKSIMALRVAVCAPSSSTVWSIGLHWNGAKLIDWPTVIAWAKTMTWKGLHPIIYENPAQYQTGISLSKVEMRPVEKRLEHNPALPKWDMWIRPQVKVPS
jgi:hypothetical protein